MTSKSHDDSSSEDAAKLFADLLDSDRAGETVDPGALAAEHPEHAVELLEGLAMISEIDAALADTAGGRIIGDFRILGEIGRGGMGVVYQAEQITLGRSVALKILPHTAIMDGKQVTRFQNEARAAAQLEHPHIVPVFAVGHDAGVHYYAMRLIDGESLRDILARRRLPPDPKVSEGSETTSSTPTGSTQWFRTVAEWIRGAAVGLEHSHQLGILHRDIKPANILIDQTGHPWITDFGLAWSLQQDSNLTMTGEMLGTLAYCSPEQAAGRHRLVDQRADVYSLGVTLYELLTLRRPFEGTDRAELLNKITNEVPRKPRRLDSRIPVDLETITCRAIGKEPEHRYQSAGEFAADIDAFLGGRPIAARPVGPVDRTWRWCRRNPGIAAALVAALLMLSVAIVVGLAAQQAIAQRNRAQRAEDEVRIVQGISSARAELAGYLIGGRTTAFEHIANAAETWREARLDPAKSASLGFDLRNAAIAALCRWGVIQREYEASEARAFTADSRFRHAARVRMDFKVEVEDLRGDRDTWKTGANATRLRFSRSGILGTIHRGRVQCLDVEARRILSTSPAGVELVRFDFTEEQVVALDRTGRLFSSEQRKGTWREIARLVDHDGTALPPPNVVSASPDGTRIAVAGRDEVIRIHAMDGELLATLREEDRVSALDWHPRGLLATGTADGMVQLWDVEEERAVAQVEGHSSLVTEVRFDLERPVLVSQSWDHTTRLWHAEDLGPMLTFVGYGARISLSDGQLGPIPSNDMKKDRYFRLVGTDCARRFAQREALSTSTPLSMVDPGGRLLVSTTRTGLAFFDLSTGWLLRHVACGWEPNSIEFETENTLYVGSENGCWRITLERGAKGSLDAASVERIYPVNQRCMVSRLPSDRLLIASRGCLTVLDPATGEKRDLQSKPHVSCMLSVRQDGRLAVVDSWFPGEGALIWDLDTGRILRKLGALRCRAVFGPRGRLWLCEPERIRILDPDGWQQVAYLETPGAGHSPSMIDFSPDGQLVAITRERVRVELRRVGDLSPVAEFKPQLGSSLHFPRFTADGCWLIATSSRRFAHAWNLQKIRDGLDRLGLDWRR